MMKKTKKTKTIKKAKVRAKKHIKIKKVKKRISTKVRNKRPAKRKQQSVKLALKIPVIETRPVEPLPPPPKSVVIKPKIVDNKSQYFTKVHEDAILEYASISNNARKTELYINLIQPAFNEMVEKIVYTYKFNNLPNIEDLKNECKVFLTTILDKYDINRGSKAFSYFSVITKNWFIHKVKKNNNKKEVYIEDLKEANGEEEFIYDHSYIHDREKEEFWAALESEMYSWFDKRLKENEIKVYKAIVMLFKESENIEIFNKKAIYLYMREITGLNTKQVVNNLKKFRYKYEDFRERWHNGDISHIKPREYKDEFY